MNKEKEIDWEQVDKEAEEHLKKCIEVEKQIKEERKKNKDLKKISEEVDEFVKENNLDTVYLEVNKDTK